MISKNASNPTAATVDSDTGWTVQADLILPNSPVYGQIGFLGYWFLTVRKNRMSVTIFRYLFQSLPLMGPIYLVTVIPTISGPSRTGLWCGCRGSREWSSYKC